MRAPNKAFLAVTIVGLNSEMRTELPFLAFRPTSPCSLSGPAPEQDLRQLPNMPLHVSKERKSNDSGENWSVSSRP